MTLRIRSTAFTLKIISWTQIIGGITGIGLAAFLMLRTAAINGPMLFVFFIGIGLF